jgi:hypothetical protein
MDLRPGHLHRAHTVRQPPNSRLATPAHAGTGPCGVGSSIGADHRRVRIGNADSAAGLFGRALLSRTYARQARRSSRSGIAVSSSSIIAAKNSGCLLSCTTGGLWCGSISMPSNSRLPDSMRGASRVSGVCARQQRRRAHMYRYRKSPDFAAVSLSICCIRSPPGFLMQILRRDG